MAVNAKLGSGTTIGISTNGGTSYDIISGVQSLGATGQTKSEVDVTSLEDGSKVFISGISEGESKAINVNWDETDAGQAVLATQAKAGNVAKFEINFSNGKKATFDMVLLGWVIDDPSGDSALKASASGRLSGDIAWA
jgi:hypothetical protein